MAKQPPVLTSLNLSRRYFPYRGFLYSLVIHELLLWGLIRLPLANILVRAMQASEPPEPPAVARLVEPEYVVWLPVLSDGADMIIPLELPAAKSSEPPAAPRPNKEGLSYPGPQPVLSDPPKPTNLVQTLLEPALEDPPILKPPLLLPNFVLMEGASRVQQSPPQDMTPPEQPKESPPPVVKPVEVKAPPVVQPTVKPNDMVMPAAKSAEPPLNSAPKMTMPEPTPPPPNPLPPEPPPVVKPMEVKPPPLVQPTVKPNDMVLPVAKPAAPPLNSASKMKMPEPTRPAPNPVIPEPPTKVEPQPKPASPKTQPPARATASPSPAKSPAPKAATPQLPPARTIGTIKPVEPDLSKLTVRVADLQNLLALTPMPTQRELPLPVPAGEAQGRFAISPTPNVTANTTEPGTKLETPPAAGAGRPVVVTAPDAGKGGPASSAAAGTSISAGPAKGSDPANASGGSGKGTGPKEGPFAGITIVGGVREPGAAADSGMTPPAPRRPLQTSFGITVISTENSGGGLPAFGVFGQRQVYTVFLDMRETELETAPAWTLEFAVLQDEAGQAAAKSQIQNQQGLVLPFPAVRQQPALPADVAGKYLGSMIIVYAVVNTDGKLEQLSVKDSPDPLLNQPLLDSLSKWVFRPGRLDGQPVRAQVLMGIPVWLPE